MCDRVVGAEEILPMRAKERLARLLQPHETILKCAQNNGLSADQCECLVALDARLVLIYNAAFQDRSQSIEYLDIKSIEVKREWLGCFYLLINDSRLLEARSVHGLDAGAQLREFAEWLRTKVREVRTSINIAPTSVSTSGEAIRELERLAALHRDGALSDVEFSQAKRKLLGL
jgi:hypothetical protein